MKAILITYEQALQPEVKSVLNKLSIIGFTRWKGITGRGSRGGEPHLGTHAYPALNDAIFVVVEDDKARKVLDALRQVDEDAKILGIRAFQWNIEDGI